MALIRGVDSTFLVQIEGLGGLFPVVHRVNIEVPTRNGCAERGEFDGTNGTNRWGLGEYRGELGA